MSDESPDITAAKISAERARARLMDTAQVLQNRLNPKTLAQNAWEGAKVKGADIAEDAVDTVKRRPLAATGIAAGIAMFLARKPLMSLAGKIAGSSSDDHDDGDDQAGRIRTQAEVSSAPANRI